MKKLLLPFLLFTFSFLLCKAQNVGIGNTNPQTALDVQGDIRFRSTNISLPAGYNGELDAATVKFATYNLLTPATITGIAGGVDGRMLTMVNTTGTSMVRIKLLDEGDTFATGNYANRMTLGNTFYINYSGSIVLRYDGFKQRWVVVSKTAVSDGTSSTWLQSSNDLYNNNSGNVGIGTSTPTERLDVNGNLNLGGQLKVSGNAGSANQSLMKDANNNLVWADLSSYKNFVVFDCTNIATSQNGNNCTATWTVPTGVTNVVVECWGGGGGGSNITGGGGGGYIIGKFTPTAGLMASISIGAGGVKGIKNSNGTVVNGTTGGDTYFVVNGNYIRALGGKGGSEFVSGSTTNIYLPDGGAFNYNIDPCIGYNGNPGGYQKTGAGGETFYADGGDAAMMSGSGGKGAFLNSTYYLPGLNSGGIQPGGGGGASPGSYSIDPGTGYPGRGGRVIVHW